MNRMSMKGELWILKSEAWILCSDRFDRIESLSRIKILVVPQSSAVLSLLCHRLCGIELLIVMAVTEDSEEDTSDAN